MRTVTPLTLALLAGCSSTPAPAPQDAQTTDVAASVDAALPNDAPAAVDARVGYPDVAPVPIDGVTNVDVVTTDVVDERGAACRAGAFRPCECTPGVGGRDYCVNMAYEGTCRCGDAGPPETDASRDAASDIGNDDAPSDVALDAASDGATPDAD
jgi:hypothetical protein